MTKAELIANVFKNLGVDKSDVQATLEAFMKEIRKSLESGENVYLRGFGSFIVKRRAAKIGRNITQNLSVKIPSHNVPVFKPSKSFLEKVRDNVPVK